MSADGNSKRVFSKAHTDASAWKGVNKENSEKTTKLNVNNATPPELERNEAAARGRPVADSLKKNSTNGANDSKVNEDEDDPCVKKHKERSADGDGTNVEEFRATPGPDPRFQQQNQTLRCYVMYTDFYRCEKLLGRDHEACTWFRDVFTSICPNEWIRRWDELRETGRFPWRDVRSQEELPGDY
ncbi:cytochrome c oxidase subunit 6b-1-like [Venturia canescens]|uniref:cytochrome c oxidase subunit 6b-1-like n=1 Tax=Venturia canescens TaxID=32260 RepID=UPI001C9C565F|nr:cytochrome c oxidase subunit 6b-1-like [Venturia canescens]